MPELFGRGPPGVCQELQDYPDTAWLKLRFCAMHDAHFPFALSAPYQTWLPQNISPLSTTHTQKHTFSLAPNINTDISTYVYNILLYDAYTRNCKYYATIRIYFCWLICFFNIIFPPLCCFPGCCWLLVAPGKFIICMNGALIVLCCRALFYACICDYSMCIAFFAMHCNDNELAHLHIHWMCPHCFEVPA